MLALAVVTILSADVGVIMLADSTNDRACRDGARAAAQANNSASALQLAQAAVATHAVNNLFLTSPTVDTSNFVYQDYGGSPPVNTSPYVSVATSIAVKVPAPVFFGGAVFDPGNGQMTLRKEYTFPIVKTELYLPP
jgi:Flp pilus assembly protein TadG